MFSGHRWRISAPSTEAVNPQSFLLVSPMTLHVKDDTAVATSPRALTIELPCGNVRWCSWHFNKQQVWRGSWHIVFHVRKLSSTACTTARACNKILIIIAACRNFSKTSLICFVWRRITIFVRMIMCVSIRWNKGYNLQMREHVAWTNND